MRQLQPQASVDDAQGDERNAPPNMDMRHNGPLLGLLEQQMVEPTGDGLNDKTGYNRDADLAVIFVKLIGVQCHPDAHAQCRNEQAVTKGHPSRVQPGAVTGGADEDGPDGKEKGESERADDCMSYANPVVERGVCEGEGRPFSILETRLPQSETRGTYRRVAVGGFGPAAIVDSWRTTGRSFKAAESSRVAM
jgi:hypothetical protein